MTPNRKTNRIRTWSAGLAATLLLTVSSTALHADTSNAELAREIAELKSQIRAMKGSITQNRVETRKAVRTARTPAPGYVLPPPSGAALPASVIPAGATPVFVTADKKMQFGALTITPGGFFAAESVFRSSAQNRELESVATSVPFGPQSNTSEFRISGRGSRAALLLEAPITPSFLVSGYVETDFQQVGVGSNYNQNESFVPRIRQAYAALDNNDYGIHVLAGQAFSLATINSKGITPRNEALTPTIDYNYVTGFVYKRQGQIRLTKDFDKKLWLSLSVENAGDSYQGCTAGVNGTVVGPNNITCNYVGAGSLAGAVGTAGTAGVSNLSLNHIPDVIGKAAYEARLFDRDIHVEGFGIYRNIEDRNAYAAGGAILNTAQNTNTNGWGAGYGVIAPIISKRLDFQSNGLIGRGIGSYATGQIADSAFQANGAPLAIREEVFNAGLIFHATPSIDIYAFGGLETAHQSTQTAAFLGGYGNPNANNSGCQNLTIAATCAGNTKRVIEITGGFWDKLYKGSFGEVRVGAQYAYQQRELFQGNGASAATATTAAAGALRYSPRQGDHIVYTSLRYYPFQ